MNRATPGSCLEEVGGRGGGEVQLGIIQSRRAKLVRRVKRIQSSRS